MDSGTTTSPQAEVEKIMIGFYVLSVTVMVAMSQAWPTSRWDQNLPLISAQNITRILHENDCWVHTQMPEHSESRIPSAGVPLPSRIYWTKPSIWENTTLSKDPPGECPEFNVTKPTIPNMSFPRIQGDSGGPFTGKYPKCNENTHLDFASIVKNFTERSYTGLPVPNGTGWYWLCRS